MATSSRNRPHELPIVMRWNEAVSDGVRHWYLASLRDDASFWGYVHVRTDALTENWAFHGQLPKPKYDQIRALIASIDIDDLEPELPDYSDGLIGLGSRADPTF